MEKKCPQCGIWFVSPIGIGHRKYCCSDCRKAADREMNLWRYRRRNPGCRYFVSTSKPRPKPTLPEEQQTRKEAVVEDVSYLLGTDTAASISTRVGYRSLKALQEDLRGWGEDRLADKLAITECVYHVAQGHVEGYRG